MVSLWSGLGGTYYYPEPEHRDEILRFLDTCREYGVSRLVTYVPRGDTIFRYAGPRSAAAQNYPRETLADYYREQGWDPFDFLVGEAVQREIAVHPYWAVFYAGVRVPDWNAEYPRQLPVLSISRWADAHPKMWRKTRSERTSLEEAGYVILSPGFAEVRDREIALFRELAECYPIEGITLEFLDGPVDEKGCTLLGYEDRIVERFRSEEGIDPFQISNQEPHWLRERQKDWDLFLAELNAVVKNVRSDLNISAVFTSRGSEQEYRNLLLDWVKWTGEGWIDELCPWSRHGDPEVVGRETEVLSELMGEKGTLTALLGTWKEGSLQDLDQLREAAQRARECGADQLGIYRADSVDFHGLWPALKTLEFTGNIVEE